jgi:hypothetical protein
MENPQSNWIHPKHDHIRRVSRAGRELASLKNRLPIDEYEQAWADLRRMVPDKAEELIARCRE